MDNMNETLENVTTNEETAPVAPVEEPAVEEPVVDGAPAEPVAKENWLSALRSKINITRKGLIIGGIAAAVLIIAIVLIVLLTGGNGKVYEYAEDGTTLSVTVLEDGFRVDGFWEQVMFSTWRTEDEGTYQKNSDGTYTLDGYWESDERLVHFTGDYYLIKRDNGKGATDVVYELGKDNKYKMYAFDEDITYSKNDDGTYCLGETDNVKLKDAGDGMYSIVSIDGETYSKSDNIRVKLDPKLGVYRLFYRSSTTYKVIEGEEKTIVRETVEGSEYNAEYWLEGEFLTAFRVSKACDYLQKQRGDDRIVYLLDEDGDVEDVITITNGKTYLDGVTYKELSDGKYYGIENGQEYRLHLNSNGTYKRYEDVSDGEIRGRLEFVWEPGEELLLKANDLELVSIAVDGKAMTVVTYGGDPIELTKVK